MRHTHTVMRHADTGSEGREATVSTDTGHGAAETEPEPGKPRRPGKLWKLGLGGLIGIFAVLACYDLASGLAGSYCLIRPY